MSAEAESERTCPGCFEKFKPNTGDVMCPPCVQKSTAARKTKGTCGACGRFDFTVYPTGLCGPCCFGDASTAGGNW